MNKQTYLHPRSTINPVQYYGRQVNAHYNSHNGYFSVRLSNRKGQFLTHTAVVELSGAAFKVYEADRKRSVRVGKKNPHAFVAGTLISLSWEIPSVGAARALFEQGYRKAGYNKFRACFYLKNQPDKVITTAKGAVLIGKSVLVLV